MFIHKVMQTPVKAGFCQENFLNFFLRVALLTPLRKQNGKTLFESKSVAGQTVVNLSVSGRFKAFMLFFVLLHSACPFLYAQPCQCREAVQKPQETLNLKAIRVFLVKSDIAGSAHSGFAGYACCPGFCLPGFCVGQ